MNSKIGAVTVTYNSAQVIRGFMDSILSQLDVDIRLFIIDNASSDATLSVLADYSDDRICVVANTDNLGVAEGNNQGIRLAIAAHCDLIMLINNDTEFDSSLFLVMSDALKRHQADMLVPKILYFQPRDKIWCAGGFFKRFLVGATGHYGEGESDKGQFDIARGIEYAPTCCMLVRSSVFDSIGLMDSRYFVYYDDTDFCWRAHQAGICIFYDPTGTLFHKVSSLTGGYESEFTVRYATRNKVYFTLKNRGTAVAVYSLLLFQLIFLIKLVIRRDSFNKFYLKQKSFMEGIKLFLQRESASVAEVI